MKNRKRESCTSGTVRDEDGNILIYSALSLLRPRLTPIFSTIGLIPSRAESVTGFAG